ncbi:hypothetical protein [Mycobacterium phage Y10]|uniref:Uncharacterized protein n=1 Tax=Mycobacterium phage Y10 TaxID=2072010 RepID=A0A2Z5XAT8_9CAUD|nr:hypothetical protein PBI_JF1_80 [Mycobacterium phage JF1]BBC43365.1 hypothetical protein [Mycobacterium phage Y10]BBC43456.1 hypothetical protein [Mycobacterium phage Y2]BBC43547.1 hypothetical protein [Mycobacterium phage Y10]
MTLIRFLDGPLAGEVRDMPAPIGGWARVQQITSDPRDLFREGAELQTRIVEYVVKRNPYDEPGVPHVGAIGEKVGEKVRVVLTTTKEALAHFGRDTIEHHAMTEFARACGEFGLVPSCVRKVFEGTRRDAMSTEWELVVPRDFGYDSVVFHVWEAVAAAPDGWRPDA